MKTAVRPQNSGDGVFANIQGARALAALAVVAYHMHALPFGQCGVDIFFVISGFIMSYVAPNEGRDFLRKRVIRIVPLYWLSTIGIYAIASLRPHWLNTTMASPAYLIKSLLFIPYIKENGHWGPLNLNGWTLEYEVFFYLVVAAALMLVRARYATAIAAAFLVAFCGFVATVGSLNLIVVYLGQPFLLEFCLGVLCYWALQASVERLLATRIWVGVAAASLAVLLVSFYYHGAPYGISRVVAYGLPGSLFIFSLLALERRGWAVRSTVIAKLGAASYSIYLLHPYVIGIAMKLPSMQPDMHSVKGVVAASTVLVVVCAIGYACHRCVEKPVLAWLNRRFNRVTARTVTVT